MEERHWEREQRGRERQRQGSWRWGKATKRQIKKARCNEEWAEMQSGMHGVLRWKICLNRSERRFARICARVSACGTLLSVRQCARACARVRVRACVCARA
eukprot:5787775-Pleurochrysis_carterae.AAC.2